MRNLEDLANNAYKFWPENIANLEREISIIPKLLDTQEKFISLLKIADSDPFSWKVALQTSTLSANIFLKHLMVLSDIGGEKLKRLKKEMPAFFPAHSIKFLWNEHEYTYCFQTITESTEWDNATLKVDGHGLLHRAELLPIMEDVINLILFGSQAIYGTLPVEIMEKCMIGGLIGKNEELERFVKQRYIWVSRITGGATSNLLGNIAQSYAMNYLKARLINWDFDQKRIPEISQNDNRTLMAFDIVAKTPENKYCAIEVSFQVTTNSVIERKAGQAQSRQNILHENNHKIAYIIDGAGNFERASALQTICRYSDCTVSFKDEELDKLVLFLKDFEGE
ncbi:MAG: hypothetical protein LBI06_01505 [Treponema sp.]|jgi:hypothetical protein|nr:hypothetical protein [Treponema sp.]